MSSKRALHFVFKVGDRTATAKFYRDVLGMKFLRHEEFEKGCEAACNGPYDGKWSKSMVGYGPEDDHFVVELTYNYGIGTYKLGNDFRGITIHSKALVDRAKAASWPVLEEDGRTVLEAPGGYKFYVVNQEPEGDPVKQVSLSCSNLSKAIEYWNGKCGMKIYSQTDKTVLLGYSDNQCKLELVDVGEKIDHASAFGRIAFSCPEKEVEEMEKLMKESNQTILTPLVRLDTPGKATVTVTIVADPDGHEICYVGDEAFRELSQVDPQADVLLDEAIKNDKSDEWFAKKGKKKAVAGH